MNLNGTQGSLYQGVTQTRPYDFGTDAIERQRVSLGQAMMDADFEYGLQATKWQTFFDVRKIPTFFDVPGTDAILSNVVSDGGAPYSNITITYASGSNPQVISNLVSIFGLQNLSKTADRAEGYFLVTGNTASTANYVAKGYIPSTSNLQTSLTFCRRGGIYNNNTMNISFSSLKTDGYSNIAVSTSNAHGILPGTPITLLSPNTITLNTTIAATANGTYIVTSVPSSNTFNLVANTLLFTSCNHTTSNAQLYVSPYGSAQHRPFDGGVLLSTLSPVHGSTVLRQSKKVFRYQSGKGILFSSGTLFCPNFDVSGVKLFGITDTFKSSPSLSTGVSLTVANPSVLGINQNLTFSSGTSSFGTPVPIVSNISGSNVSFTCAGSYPSTTPASVYQSVVTTGGASTAFSTLSLPVTSILGFGFSENFTVSGAPGLTGTTSSASGSTLAASYTGNFPNKGVLPGANVVLATPVTLSAFSANPIINLAVSGTQTYFPASTSVNIAADYASNIQSIQTGSIRLMSNTGSAPVYNGFKPTDTITKKSATTSSYLANTVIVLSSPITTYNANSAVNGITGFVGNVIATTSSSSTINVSPTTWTSISSGLPVTFGQQATVTNLSNTLTLATGKDNLPIGSTITTSTGFSAVNTTQGVGGTPFKINVTNWPATGVPSTGACNVVIASANYTGNSITGSSSNLIFNSAFTYPVAASTQLTFNGTSPGTVTLADATSVPTPNVTFTSTTGIPIGTSLTLGPGATITQGNTFVAFTNVNAPTQVFVAGEPITVFSTYSTTVSTVGYSNISFVATPPNGVLSSITINPTTAPLSLVNYQTPVNPSSYTNFPTAGANVQVNSSFLTQINKPESSSMTLVSSTPIQTPTTVSPFTQISRAYAIVPSINVSSTNGFSVGETITFPLNSGLQGSLGTTSILTLTPQTASSNGIITINYSNDIPTGVSIPVAETVAGASTNIIGNGPIVANVNSATQLFSAGQIVATYLGQNMGQVTIQSAPTTQVSGNTQVSLIYTGAFPPTGIPAGTTLTTLPVGSNIQISTDSTNGIPTSGSTATLRNFGTSNINGTGYNVTTAVDSRTLNVQSQNILTSVNPNLGDQPRLAITNWHGSSVRAGIFDDANGMFWEYDGQNLYVVRRQSTFSCCGSISVSPGAQILLGTVSSTTTTNLAGDSPAISVGQTSVIINVTPGHSVVASMYTYYAGIGYMWVIGVPSYNNIQLGFLPIPPNSTWSGSIPNNTSLPFSLPSTRFQDQLKVNDRFTIRGMIHQVTSIQGQGVLTFNPPYRGASLIDTEHPVTICKIKELRVPQSQFNRDTVDGKGPSGFKVDLSRMQMIGIQYTWYGAGFIDYMLRGPDGNWVYAHRIRNNNVNDEAYMRSGNLPVRYELTVENRNAVTTLASSITSATSTIQVNDPTTYFPPSGTLLIDNELVSYSNATPTGFTVLSRAAALTYSINDVNRTLTGQNASDHLSGTSVNLVSCTATPTLTHWGSSFLTDGGFDQERGYYFNYSNTAVNLGSGTNTVTVPILGALAVAAGSPSTWQAGDTLTFSTGTPAPGTVTVGSVNAAGPYITVNFNPSYVISVQLPLYGWIASHVVTISGAGTTVPTSPTLSTVAITGTGGQFSCTSASLSVNQALTISGTLGGTGTITGYTNPTTYYIITTNGTTTFTLSATLGGTAITTTAGTPTGLTYTLVLSINPVNVSAGTLTIGWAGIQSYIFPIGTVITNASASSTINQKVIVAAAASGSSTSVALTIQAVGAGSGATATFLASHAVTNFLTVTGASVASSAPGTVTLTVTGVTPASIASGTSIVDTASGATLLTNGITSLTSTTPQNITVGTKVTNSTRSSTTAIATVATQVSSGASSGFALYFNPITSNFTVGDVVTTAGITGGTTTISSISVNPPQLVLSYTGTLGSISQYAVVNDTTNSLTAYASAAGTAGATNSACAFAIRLAPSVTNGLTGDIGIKELLNRAQLLLQKLEVTSPFNVLTVGILNPTNITFNSASWINVNTNANGTQPSFVQYYPGNLITGIPQPGERVFSTIVQANNQNNLDLSALKEMSNSVIGGNQNFPDGPDTLVIYLQNLTTSSGTVQVNLFWSEAQA